MTRPRSKLNERIHELWRAVPSGCRLCHIGVAAGGARLRLVAAQCIGGDDDDGDVFQRRICLDTACSLVAVEKRELNVHQPRIQACPIRDVYCVALALVLRSTGNGERAVAIDGSLLLISMLLLSPMTSQSHHIALVLPVFAIVAMWLKGDGSPRRTAGASRHGTRIGSSASASQQASDNRTASPCISPGHCGMLATAAC
jgi:hypothetical protein